MLENEGEREKLSHVIRRWNNSRLDLFEISQPDKDLAFQGVMRFYLEDPAGGNVATKCLRFCSNTSTREVVQALWEKFRPDLKMLSDCYRLYEMHGDTERELGPDERPLVVQLNWNSDHREGRFVLKQSKERTEESSHHKGKGGMIQTFKRSRKEKKKKKVPDGSRGNAANQTPQAPQEPPANQRQGDAPARRHTGSGHWGVLKQLGLPLGIWLSDDGGEAFVSAVINCSSSSTAHFKLSPAYALYAAGCSALRGPASSSPGRTCNVTSMANKMAAMTGEVIQRQQGIAGALAFWMANTSELLNFFQNDKDLSGLTRQSQLDLSLLVHEAYSHLIGGLQSELQKHLPTFFMDPEQHGLLPPGTGDTPLKPCVPHAEKSCLSHRRLLSVTEMVLNTLLDTMSLLRRCRVNPTLAIQLFSQLFHFISSWLFNCLMSPDAATSGLRSHYWGAVLRQRLTGIRAWAERQGLELAADCHLGRIIQATMLLTMAKYTTQDAKHIQHTCFKLNSLQMQALLAGYFYASDEPDIPADLIDAVVTAAKASADAEIEREGRDVELEESLHLRLPFLLPEGGYSCCSVRGIPPGFREFLEPICHRGLCWFTSQHNPDADWTVFFTQTPAPAGSPSMESQREPEGVTFTLRKPPHSSLGVSIVAAKGAGQDHLGIYIKSIVKGGPAAMSGRLAAGDQLLSVDSHSLLGLSQERAAAIMTQTGPAVSLKVAKFAADRHGLRALLCGPTAAIAAGEDSSHCRANWKELLQCNAEGPPQHPGGRCGRGRIMHNDQQLYRSYPSVASYASEDEDDDGDEDVQGNKSASDLSTDMLHRDSFTLPALTSQDKRTSARSQPQQMFQVCLRPLGGHKRSFMRPALSQENLCVDTGGPLLDKRQKPRQSQGAQQSTTYSQLPIRPSFSSQDISSDKSKVQQGTCTRVWRTPFSQQATPTPSIQPVRVDIPVTRALAIQANPPLTTFQQSSSVVAPRLSEILRHNYGCPIPAAKKLPLPAKHQVSITPTKQVSFQEPPTQHKQGTGPTRPKDLQEHTEAQEKLEEKPRPQDLELLEQEARKLEDKAERSAEEAQRLHKLSLEWRFQMRRQQGDDDEDADVMVMKQQLGTRAQNERTAPGNPDSNFKEKTKSLPVPKDETKDPRPGECLHGTPLFQNHLHDNTAPEKLTFKECQRLFSPPSST
ncbi:afadin isoform X2 [Dunckerocampus dactyliophorus]|uniref:afadin isoform X2 n=1 Tax=Dunckerocampus dactyliophorus TaxID=161453 RepID=UPI002404A738|nr:afadin isoform X2 [Dunckerocampus dactyliophorus]